MLPIRPGKTVTLGGLVVNISDFLPKTSGTIYAMIQYDNPVDTANHGKYWGLDGGGSWEAAASITTWPSATHSASGWWTYALPAAANSYPVGSRYHLVKLTDNVATPGSETVMSGSLQSAYVEVATNDNLRDAVESMRCVHTAQMNQIFYVDPTNGGTIAGGYDGSRGFPLNTVTEALSLVSDSMHSVIYLVSGATGGATTLTETVTVNKRYTFIRGPGRDMVWTRSGAGDTITVTADGVELCGFQVNTAATGAGSGVVVNGADFTRLRSLWVNDTQGDGVEIIAASNCVVEDCTFQDSGVSGAGHGLVLDPTTGTVDHTLIRNNIFADVQGDSIRLAAGGTVSNTIIDDNTIHGSTGWGVNVAASTVSDTMITDNRLGNNTSGDITDSGTNTQQINNTTWHATPTGARTITVSLQDQNTDPFVYGTIDIYDSSNTTFLWTVSDDDADGDIAFNISDGTYSLRITGPHFVADNLPETLVVTADATPTYSGTYTTVASGGDPSLCTVSGYLLDAGGNAVASEEIRFWGDAPIGIASGVAGNQITATVLTATTDANGLFSIDLVRGAKVKIGSGVARLDGLVITIPASGSSDFAALTEAAK